MNTDRVNKEQKIKRELRKYRKALGAGAYRGTFQEWIAIRKGGYGESWDPITPEEAAAIDRKLEAE